MNMKYLVLVFLILFSVVPVSFASFDDFDRVCCLRVDDGNVDATLAEFCRGSGSHILGLQDPDEEVQGAFSIAPNGRGSVDDGCRSLVLDRGLNCVDVSGSFVSERFFISVDGLNIAGHTRAFPDRLTCQSYSACSGNNCAWFDDGSVDGGVNIEDPVDDSQTGVIVVPREEEVPQISAENLGLRPFDMVQGNICESSNLPFGGAFMSRNSCEAINDDCVYDPLRAGVLTQREGDSRSQGLFSRLLPDIMCVSKSNRISSCEDINSRDVCEYYEDRLKPSDDSLMGMYGCEWREVSSRVGTCITSGIYYPDQESKDLGQSKGISIAQSILRNNFVSNPTFEVMQGNELRYWDGDYTLLDNSDRNNLLGLQRVRLNSNQQIFQLISGIPARANFEVRLITNNPSNVRVLIDSQVLTLGQERPLFEFRETPSDLTLMVFEFSNDIEFANRELAIASSGNADIFGVSLGLFSSDDTATLRRVASSIFTENLFPQNSFDCQLCSLLSTVGTCTSEGINSASKCTLISSDENQRYRSPAQEQVNPYVTHSGIENMFVETHMTFCGAFASQSRCEDPDNFLNSIMAQYHNTDSLCRWAVDDSLTNGGFCFKDSSGDQLPDTVNNGALSSMQNHNDLNTYFSSFNLDPRESGDLNDFQLSCDSVPPRVFIEPYKRTANSVGPVTDANLNEVGVIDFVYVRIENYQSPACSVFENFEPNLYLVFNTGINVNAEDLFPEFNRSFRFFENTYSYSQFRNLLSNYMLESQIDEFFETGSIEVFDQSGNRQVNRIRTQIGEIASRPRFDISLVPNSEFEMYSISSLIVEPTMGSSLEQFGEFCDIRVIDVEESLTIVDEVNISFTNLQGNGYQIGQRIMDYETQRRDFNDDRDEFLVRVFVQCRDIFNQEESNIKDFNFITNNGIIVHQFSNEIFNPDNIPYLDTVSKTIFLNMSARQDVSCTNSFIRGISLNPGSQVDPEVHFSNQELEGIDFSVSSLAQYTLAVAVGLAPQDSRLDVTNTGTVTTRDALEILRVQVGLEASDPSYVDNINSLIQQWGDGSIELISEEFASLGAISFSQTSNIEGYPQRFEDTLDFSGLITQDGLYEYVLECTYQGEPFTRSLKFEYNTQNVDISSLKIVERDNERWTIIDGNVYIDAVGRNLISNSNIPLTSEFNNYVRTRLMLYVEDLGEEVESISICNNDDFEINRLNPIITQDLIGIGNDEGCNVEFIEEDSVLKFTSPIRVTNKIGNTNEKTIVTLFEVFGPRIEMTTQNGGMVIDDVLYFNTDNPQFRVNLGLASFREFNCEIQLELNSNILNTIQRNSMNSNINFGINDISNNPNILNLPNTEVFLDVTCEENLFGRSDSLRVRLQQDTQPPQIEHIRFLDMGTNWAYPLSGISSIHSDVEVILSNDEIFVSCDYMVTDESSEEFIVGKNLRTASGSNTNVVVDSDAKILTRGNSDELPLVTISNNEIFSTNRINHSIDVACTDAAGNRAQERFEGYSLSLLNFGELQVSGRGDSSNNLMLRVTSLTPLDGSLLTITDLRRNEVFYSGLLDSLDIVTTQSGSVFEIEIRNIKSLSQFDSAREYPFRAEFSFNQGMEFVDEFDVLIDNEKPTINLNVNTNDDNVIFGNVVSGTLTIEDGPDFSRGLRSVEIALFRDGELVDIVELSEDLGYQVSRNLLYDNLTGGDYMFLIRAVDMFGNSEELEYFFELNDGFGVRLLSSDNVYLNELAPMTWYTQNRLPTLRFETFKAVESCTLRPGVDGGYIGSSYEFRNVGSNIFELNLEDVSGFQIRDGRHRVVLSCIGVEGDDEDVGDVGVFLYFINTIPDYTLNIEWGRTLFIRPGETTRSFNVTIEQRAAFRDVTCELTLINPNGNREQIELQERFSEDIGSYIANLDLAQGRYSLELQCSTPVGVSGPTKVYEIDVVRQDFEINLVSMKKVSNGLEINTQNSPIVVPRPQSFNEDSSEYRIQFTTNYQEQLNCSVETPRSGFVNFVRSLFINSQIEAQSFPQTLDLYESVVEIDPSVTSIDISCRRGQDFSSQTFRFPISLFDESGFQIGPITVEGER